MDVFFNEMCLVESQDIDSTLLFLFETLSVIKNEKINIYTQFAAIATWKNEFEPIFDASALRYYYQASNFLDNCNDDSGQFYYHYITHQDFVLSISHNIAPSSIINATNKIINSQPTAILNLPKSKFGFRPNLPIIKSSHNFKIKDSLINIPCFDNAKDIISYIFLQEKIQPFFKDDNDSFNTFSNDYFTYVNTYDFQKWKPKTFGPDKKLVQEILFPIIKYESIKTKILGLEIDRKSTEDNIASFRIIGGIILVLHGYVKNFKLSSHYNYDIYERGFGNKKLLISIDRENSAFEVIESSGTHIGVYGYDGKYIKHYSNKEELNDHSLLNIPTHLFLFI